MNWISKKGYTTAAVLVALTTLIASLFAFLPKFQVSNDSQVLGSVTQGNEYMSTTTRSHDGVELTNLTVLKTGPGALGSFVITGAGGQVNLYDATTSNASLRTKSATTTLAIFPTSTGNHTYTFDVIFNYGLLFEEIGSVATGTITWR